MLYNLRVFSVQKFYDNPQLSQMVHIMVEHAVDKKTIWVFPFKIGIVIDFGEEGVFFVLEQGDEFVQRSIIFLFDLLPTLDFQGFVGQPIFRIIVHFAALPRFDFQQGLSAPKGKVRNDFRNTVQVLLGTFKNKVFIQTGELIGKGTAHPGFACTDFGELLNGMLDDGVQNLNKSPSSTPSASAMV